LATVSCTALAQRELPVDQIRLPPGFTISVVARVPNARAMTFGSGGTLFVGSGGAGNVYAVRLPASDDGEASVRTIASGLRQPAGVAFRGGALYVSAVDRILRFDDIERRLDDPGKPVVVTDRFPSDYSHGRKFIAFGPDGKLYVPVGMPCNVCALAPASRSSRVACATASASTGTRRRATCGSPTTGATGWATMRRPTSSTALRAPE